MRTTVGSAAFFCFTFFLPFVLRRRLLYNGLVGRTPCDGGEWEYGAIVVLLVVVVVFFVGVICLGCFTRWEGLRAKWILCSIKQREAMADFLVAWDIQYSKY